MSRSSFFFCGWKMFFGNFSMGLNISLSDQLTICFSLIKFQSRITMLYGVRASADGQRLVNRFCTRLIITLLFIGRGRYEYDGEMVALVERNEIRYINCKNDQLMEFIFRGGWLSNNRVAGIGLLVTAGNSKWLWPPLIVKRN